MLAPLVGCVDGFTTDPFIVIEGPATGGFVGTSLAECREITVTGRVVNMPGRADYAVFVQGERVSAPSLRPTGATGIWTFSKKIDLLPWSPGGGGSASTATRYPVAHAGGWDRRVRPFVAELVDPADVADTSSFVARDVVTAIDVRRDNCRSWAASWETGEATDALSVYVSGAGIELLEPVIEAAIPHPELPDPHEGFDTVVAGGLRGPIGSTTCLSWADVDVVPSGWDGTLATLQAAAVAANAAATAASLPKPYPDPLSATSWGVCAAFTSEFEALEWVAPTGLDADPTVDPLALSWSHVGADLSLLATPSDVEIAYLRSAIPDPAMSAAVSMDACVVDGTVDVDVETTVALLGGVDPGTLDASADGVTVAVSPSYVDAEGLCGAGAFADEMASMVSGAASQLETTWAGTLDEGGSRSHAALATRSTFEGAVPGLVGVETQAEVVTDPTPTYRAGDPTVCDEDAGGVYMVMDVDARPAGGMGGPAGPSWLRWGTDLLDEPEDEAGVLTDPSNCHEVYIDGERVLRGTPHHVSTLMTTAPANRISHALSGDSLRLTLRGGVDAGADDLAAAMGLPRGRWAQVEVTVEPELPSFLSPEWSPQVGQWAITVADRSRPGEPLLEAVADAWLPADWDTTPLVAGSVDDHFSFTGFSAADVFVQVIPRGGTARPTTADATAALEPALSQAFAAHAQAVARHFGHGEWDAAIGGPWFSTVSDEPQRWQDNRGLLPVTLTP